MSGVSGTSSGALPRPSARHGLARIPVPARMIFYGVFFLVVALVGFGGLNYKIDRAWPACHVEIGAWRIVGVAIFVAALVAYVAVAALLSRRGQGAFVEFDPPTRLVHTGPYAWVRNPVSLCVLAMILGEAIALSSTGVLAMFFVSLGIAQFQAVCIEEPLLEKRFGQAYLDYRARVARWIPRRPRHA